MERREAKGLRARTKGGDWRINDSGGESGRAAPGDAEGGYSRANVQVRKLQKRIYIRVM